MKKLYKKITGKKNPIIFTKPITAEMMKYANNAILANRLSFMNQIANLCGKVGADINIPERGIGLDSRIGKEFLKVSCGFGGSCFPKDIKELINLGQRNGLNLNLIKSIEDVNNQQKMLIPNKIAKVFGENLSNYTFAVWGLSFKANTDDVRESSAMFIIEELAKKGAAINCYDPIANEKAKNIINEKLLNNIFFFNDKLDAINNCDALVIATEWEEFITIDFSQLNDLLKNKIVFDGRNIWNKNKLEKQGYKVFQIGSGLMI